jgi:hypothetical protein
VRRLERQQVQAQRQPEQQRLKHLEQQPQLEPGQQQALRL